MKRFILPSVLLTILLLPLTSSVFAKDGGNKGGNNAKGNNGHRGGHGVQQPGHGGHGKPHGGHHGGRHGGHYGHRPHWGFGLWAPPPMYPYRGGYYRPYPQPYMRPYGGYYRPGNFGFFFNF